MLTHRANHWPKSHSCDLTMVLEAQAGSLPGPTTTAGNDDPVCTSGPAANHSPNFWLHPHPTA